MKLYLYLLLLGTIVLLPACQDDDDIAGLTAADLHYDAENFSAPLLDPGTHTAGVRFTEAELSPYIGKNLTEVLFFIQELPASCILSIYGEGASGGPGDRLYEQDLTNNIGSNGWNQHPLLFDGVEITGEDLWICVEVVHNSAIRSVGCDPGTALENGDWLLTTTDSNGWQTLRNYTDNEVDINWNIRARVSD